MFVLVGGVLFAIAMPYVFSVFTDETLEIVVINESQRPISVSAEITDLDTNRTIFKTFKSMQTIEPGATASGTLVLDGWAPESCGTIVIADGSSKHTYDCGPRNKETGRYVTRNKISFR